MSPEREEEIDALSMKSQANKEKRMNEWAELFRKQKTDQSLRDWLEQNKE